jgi:hypothetical protein
MDGQREEVLARLDGLGGGHRAQNDGFAEGRKDGAIGLARNAPGFELEGLAAQVDFDSLDIKHIISFARAPNAAKFIWCGQSGPRGVGHSKSPVSAPPECDALEWKRAPGGALGNYLRRPSLAMRSL